MHLHRRRSEPHGHALDPRLHVRWEDALDLHVGERGGRERLSSLDPRPSGPDLGLGPLPVPLPEGDVPCLRIHIGPSHDRGRHLIDPLLGIDLAREVPGVLLAAHVPVAGLPRAARRLLDACHPLPNPRLVWSVVGASGWARQGRRRPVPGCVAPCHRGIGIRIADGGCRLQP